MVFFREYNNSKNSFWVHLGVWNKYKTMRSCLQALSDIKREHKYELGAIGVFRPMHYYYKD
jgi:hypothetical protein